MDPTEEKKLNGRERTQFTIGNKAAVGRGDPSLKALTRQFLKQYLTEKLGSEILDAQSIRALEGDTTAAKFVYDYCGHKPVDQVEQMSTVFTPEETARIKQHGWPQDEAE